MRYLIYFLLTILLLTNVFSQSTINPVQINDLYSECIKNSNSLDECKTIIENSRLVSSLISNIYMDPISSEEYLDCAKNQVRNNNLSYTSVRDVCISSISNSNKIKSVIELFNTKCSYKLNNTNLDVTCKSMFPTTCYDLEISLRNESNKYLVEPVAKKNNLECSNIANFKYATKQFSLPIQNITESNYPNIEIINTKILDKDNYPLQVENIFETVDRGNFEITNVEKSYYNCLSLYLLNNNFNQYGVIIDNNLLENNNVINACLERVTYSHSIYLEQTIKERNSLLNNIKLEINNLLNSQDLTQLNSFFNSVLSINNQVERINSRLNMRSTNLNINFESDILFERLKSALDSPKSNTDELKLGFKVTLMNNLVNQIKVKDIENFENLIKYFEEKKALFSNDSSKSFLNSVRNDIVLEFFMNNDMIDLTNVDFSISKDNIKIGDLLLDFKQPVLVHSSNKYVFTKNNDNMTFSLNNNLDINTKLLLNVSDNKLEYNSKPLYVLEKLKERSYNQKIESINLTENNGVLTYNANILVNGYFLGLFNVSIRILEMYNAEDGILYSVEKPWWDFMVVYSKSVRENINEQGKKLENL